MYIADGNNIRMVDEFGTISTLAGHQHHRATWKPLPCVGTIPISEVRLINLISFNEERYRYLILLCTGSAELADGHDDQPS